MLRHKGGETASRKCPNCHSKRIWKDGKRKTRNALIQRFVCRECGYRFGESAIISTNNNYTFARQICVTLTEGTKNLTKVKARTMNRLAGATTNNERDLEEFVQYLLKQGKKNSTIDTYSKYIQILAQNGKIFDPEKTKLTIAKHFTEQNTKRLATYAYDSFLKFIGIKWEKPNYRKEDKKTFIPTNEELLLAVNCGTRPSTIFSQLIHETGARVNEAERVEWTDIDPTRTQITIKASKNGNSRILTISKELMNNLLTMPKTETTIFPKKKSNSRQANFYRRMQKLTRQHNNPRFKKIHYHTFRHCKALREFHKTKNILHVKRVLGHKSIMTTQRYVELYEEVYGNQIPENFICETASSEKERKKLIESGFDWVGQDNNGITYFRKVK